MAVIVKRNVKGRRYYYLEHTIRKKGKHVQKSRYLGKTIPNNIAEIKKQFLFELNKAEWFDDFERIRRNYNAESRSIPRSAMEKAVHEFSVRFTYNTQRIEGSTLTLRETAELLERKISPGGKPIKDAIEAVAHDRLFREMLTLKNDLSQELVEDWNWRLLKETEPDVAGKIRRHGVRISGSKFIPPAPVELQPMLNDFFRWYQKARREANPVELAALVHLKFVTMHPFADGNGRISRLMMNFVLQRHRFPMMSIEYNRRSTYYSALGRSQVGKDERPFVNWFFRRYKRDNEKYLIA